MNNQHTALSMERSSSLSSEAKIVHAILTGKLCNIGSGHYYEAGEIAVEIEVIDAPTVVLYDGDNVTEHIITAAVNEALASRAERMAPEPKESV